MPPTTRETDLSAPCERLSTLPATVLRGEVLSGRVPAEGLLILRDGEPGEPEVTLSPLRYHYQHRADRTLGGLCDWVEEEAQRLVDLPARRRGHPGRPAPYPAPSSRY
ncbi:MAG: hypothetical protein K5905_24945 [Roseibium sp.]|uniref:hypothetical protein n=1 Tax=Roseibium sp. TaxID=1936156 RepID=UPI00261E520B|nr:hypothetical protein [Roseibium sp.]MCV0428716.1 hypothetical protein [Roseibium sp.]